MRRGPRRGPQNRYYSYLRLERCRYGYYNSEDNEVPEWLIHEYAAFDWLQNWDRLMQRTSRLGNVSKQTILRMKSIRTCPYIRYKDLSPALEKSVQAIACELSNLSNELFSDDEYQPEEKRLSPSELERWKEAERVSIECTQIRPDREWRENWEKENVAPDCTRMEATVIAAEYVLEKCNIELDIRDGFGSDWSAKAKNHVLKFSFETGEDFTEKKCGTVTVDMTARKVIDFTEDIEDNY